MGGFGCGGSRDAMDDETGPLLADPGRCDWEFMSASSRMARYGL